MLHGGISRQKLLLATLGAKSDKIKILRQQYDAFLAEDKKRKERNEYILNRLDKMRRCDYLVPCKGYFVNDNLNFNNQVHNRYAHISESLRSVEPPPTESVDETKVLLEISKKYIMIPRTKNAGDNNESLFSKTDVKLSSFDDNDWKSKYMILNQLKEKEKEDDTVFDNEVFEVSNNKNVQMFDSNLNKEQIDINCLTLKQEEIGNVTILDNVEVQNDKNVEMFDLKLNKEPVDIHCSALDNPYNKYENPERDYTSETKKAKQNLHEENSKTGSNYGAITSVPVEILKTHQNTIKINEDSSRIDENKVLFDILEPKISSTEDNKDLLQNLASAENKTEQQSLEEAVVLGTYNNQPQVRTETYDVSVDGQNQLEKEQDYEKQSSDRNVNSYAEDKEQYAKDDYQYTDPNITHEQIASTDAVQQEDQNQVYSQGYEQEESNQYNPVNYAEDENAAYANESYAYEDHNQQYYNDPNINQGQYQEQQYQEHDYQGQHAVDQEYSNLPQDGENRLVDATNANFNQEYLSQLEPKDPTTNSIYYSETPTVQDSITKPCDGREYLDQDNFDVIIPAQNADYVEDEFESEARMYNDVVPAGSVVSGIVSDENNLQPDFQVNYNAEYNQIAENPLDVYDNDATLQKYDQSYEVQYTGNYDEEVPNIHNTQVAYEPIPTQLEDEEESLVNIEKALDDEYNKVNDLQNISDAAVTIKPNEQLDQQSAKLEQDAKAYGLVNKQEVSVKESN